jgi:hypothetical protein
MAKLNVKSATVASSSERGPEEVIVTDERGRAIGVRRLRMSIRRQVLQRLEPQLADREKYLGLVMLAACCSSIDGDAVRMPVHTSEWDVLMDRLDDEGFEAIGRAISENFIQRSQAEVVAEAKN